MKHDLIILQTWFRERNMIMNTKKTKFMIFRQDENMLTSIPLNNSELNEDKIERVQVYEYLGWTNIGQFTKFQIAHRKDREKNFTIYRCLLTAQTICESIYFDENLFCLG